MGYSLAPGNTPSSIGRTGEPQFPRELPDMPVDSTLLNKFVVGIRDSLARLNEALHDKFRQIDDELAQLKYSTPEGNVAEKV